MNDFSRYLPLSQRDRVDESRTTSNWAGHIGTALLHLADALDAAADDAARVAADPGGRWHSPALLPGYRVADTVGALLWRLGTPWPERGRALVAARGAEGGARLALARGSAPGSEREAAREVRALAITCLAPRAPRRRVGELGATLADAWDVSVGLGTTLDVDPVASGAAALARALSAPLPIRSVVRGRTLRATDADWSVGAGPVIEGTAASIVLFLYGRGGVPQTNPASPPTA